MLRATTLLGQENNATPNVKGLAKKTLVTTSRKAPLTEKTNVKRPLTVVKPKSNLKSAAKTTTTKTTTTAKSRLGIQVYADPPIDTPPIETMHKSTHNVPYVPSDDLLADLSVFDRMPPCNRPVIVSKDLFVKDTYIPIVKETNWCFDVVEVELNFV